MTQRIHRSHVTTGIRNVKRHLTDVQEAIDNNDVSMAFTCAEQAQMAAFNLKIYLTSGDPEDLKEGE